MLRLSVVLVAPVLLSSCSTSISTTTRPHTDAGSQESSPAPASSPAVQLACGTPETRLIEWAKVGLATHSGPVTATTLVPAATTPTGAWSVLGVERRYVYDDGTEAGGASRTFALVNGTDADQRKLIPIATASTQAGSSGLHEDWSAVSWTGETLAAGKEALAYAVDCIDDARAGDITDP